MNEPQAPDVNKRPETPLQACLGRMRAKICKIEEVPNPAVQRMAMCLRHEMIELVSLVNDLKTSAAARRMIGEAEALKPQAPIDETPLFMAAAEMHRTPSADELQLLQGGGE